MTLITNSEIPYSTKFPWLHPDTFDWFSRIHCCLDDQRRSEMEGPVFRDGKLVSLHPAIRTRRKLQFHREGLVSRLQEARTHGNLRSHRDTCVWDVSMVTTPPEIRTTYGNLNFAERPILETLLDLRISGNSYLVETSVSHPLNTAKSFIFLCVNKIYDVQQLAHATVLNAEKN